MEKTIVIDGQQINFKATGATVRLYRQQFKRDLLLDIQKLNECFVKQKFDSGTLECFENLCYVMAKQGDSSVSENIEEWFDNFSMFSIYEVLPQVIELWNMSADSTVQQKKSNEKPSAQ